MTKRIETARHTGPSRRDFLKIGGLAMGGLSLPQILRAEAQSGVGRSPKSVIMATQSSTSDTLPPRVGMKVFRSATRRVIGPISRWA